ncbi:MAG: 50S ribosomal protein L29 [Candidatus Babeliales bacterium]
MDLKKKDFTSLDAQQLAQRLQEMRQELFSLRLTAVTSPIKDYKKFGKLRKNIARALTYLGTKQQNQ